MNLTFIAATILLALGGHLAEITFWAFVLDMSGAVPDIGAALYSSAGSYTTSGSDIVLPPQWRLLAPFEAVDGMLMFGVSTAFIFAVVNRLIHARYEDADTTSFFEDLPPSLKTCRRRLIRPPAGPPRIVSRYSHRPAP